MKQNFAAIILGGTGQVGGAAVAELLTIPECREVVMVTRKAIAARLRVRSVVLDTGAADFAEGGRPRDAGAGSVEMRVVQQVEEVAAELG